MVKLLPDNVPSVTIIVPQRNHPELTVTAVRTLRETDPVRWPVLIVDNGSCPHSLRTLQMFEDDATEILSLPRPGLTAAWNRAAERSKTDYLIFLNNDTCSRGPWVAPLLRPICHSHVIVTGPEIRCERLLKHPQNLLAGWCFALRRSTFQSLGGFDESLQLYFSDTDLLLRIAKSHPTDPPPWQAVPHLPLIHLQHRTTHRLGDHRACWTADRDRFLERWRGYR